MTSPQRDDESAFERLNRQKDNADQAVEFSLGYLWPLLLLAGGPALTGLISANVAEQRDFAGLFLSTLAWSAGIALFVFLLQTKVLGEVGGWPFVILGVICLFVGSFIAAGIGEGMYSVPVENEMGSNPLGWVLGYAKAAMITFGPLGAVLGGAAGAAAGYRAGVLYLDKR